jgi:hypothetical protein
MTSIALSGRWRSVMKRTDSSTAEVSAAAEYLMPWWDFEARFEPLEDLDRFGTRWLVDVDLLEAP